MKISFAVCVHNEGLYIEALLNQLYAHIESNKTEDEIVILDDLSDDMKTSEVLLNAAEKTYVSVYKRKFDGDFAAHKNYLNSLCKKDYIFQIDADELLDSYLLSNISTVLDANPLTEMYAVPRVNTVEGLTLEYINKWHWQVDDRGWINFPDYQTRILKKGSEVHWEGKVHERLRGAKYWSALPEQKEWALIHNKKLERQIQQNNMYDEIAKKGL